MGVRDLPVRVSREQYASEAAERLRSLAAEIDGDPDVRGLMVIVDRSSPDGDNLRTVNTGILKQSRERAFWVVSRIRNWMVSRDT